MLEVKKSQCRKLTYYLYPICNTRTSSPSPQLRLLPVNGHDLTMFEGIGVGVRAAAHRLCPVFATSLHLLLILVEAPITAIFALGFQMPNT